MKIIIEDLNKEFLESISFLKDKESILIDFDLRRIIINTNSVSKARAILNLLFRLIKIYEDLGGTLSKL